MDYDINKYTINYGYFFKMNLDEFIIYIKVSLNFYK